VRLPLELDEDKDLWQRLPISEAAVTTVIDVYASLPAGVFLRTADALHLATAKVNAAKKCYSNDTRLIEAAGYFRVQGENILQQN
jgi:predicted nucleic acid-binding protein